MAEHTLNGEIPLHRVTISKNARGAVQIEVAIVSTSPEQAAAKAQEIFDRLQAAYKPADPDPEANEFYKGR